MALWQSATLVFFVYLAVVAALPGRPRPRHTGRLYAGAAAGLLLTLAVSPRPHQPVLHDWVVPPILLLLGYWVSGLLFTGPDPGQERALIALDRRLRILGTARRMPAALAAALEVAYVGVYPVIPVALALHLVFVPGPDPAWFWSVILVTDYICFGCLPWVQTRPPRALETCEPWVSAVRRFNLRFIGTASIQANTFPSGHAAEALAAVFLLFGAPWPIVVAMSLVALAISAGAVYGRYHYAADAFAGWAVATGVWALLR